MRSECHFQSLFYRALIAVEPVESFLDHLIAGRNVSCFEDSVAFVFFRHPKRLEHHILRGFREKLIVAAVDHQGGHRHPWREIDFIDFGKFLAIIKTSTEQHKHLDAFLDRRKNVPEVCAGAQAIEGELFQIEVFACLEVIKRSSQVLRPVDDVVAIENRGVGVVRLHCVTPLVMTLVNRIDEGAATLDDEVAPKEVKGPTGPLKNCV